MNKLNPSGTTNKFTKLDLFRIRNYKEEGETIKASIAINDGVDPPPLSHRLRTHQRWLSLNLREVIAPFLLDKKYQDKLQRVEEWVRHDDLDDSLVLHYNLPTKQLTVTTTLRTDAANDRTNNEESDDGGDEKKYLKGPNYGSGCVPKMPTTSQKAKAALEMILNRGSILLL
eukprot:scaffold6994_cov145-Skeletonema_dohrnii-CCMP3373.AAC.9